MGAFGAAQSDLPPRGLCHECWASNVPVVIDDDTGQTVCHACRGSA